ncbi:MAG: hypothetical protein UY48_C0033G0002 [Candidatus Gottesmanbacteria bacterium GW2011_GWB1_49_7]|uniref:Uncharacterized protein n=1 Tax=Candidatus Gottesmanbacteria bacterium GW2011_GWB1_49_7 TaxID=1618448 RepID=A0A0G1YWB3_9BACT|nr:MAG: hypothetical protein UY48_C0033G0002 [Candidatus Gottesmanbacteria bacterium GW2011_GWB1_49_7]
MEIQRKLKATKLPWNGFGESWGVKCLDCNKWLTKYDYTKKEALAVAEQELCKCKS